MGYRGRRSAVFDGEVGGKEAPTRHGDDSRPELVRGTEAPRPDRQEVSRLEYKPGGYSSRSARRSLFGETDGGADLVVQVLRDLLSRIK